MQGPAQIINIPHTKSNRIDTFILSLEFNKGHLRGEGQGQPYDIYGEMTIQEDS